MRQSLSVKREQRKETLTSEFDGDRGCRRALELEGSVSSVEDDEVDPFANVEHLSSEFERPEIGSRQRSIYYRVIAAQSVNREKKVTMLDLGTHRRSCEGYSGIERSRLLFHRYSRFATTLARDRSRR